MRAAWRSRRVHVRKENVRRHVNMRKIIVVDIETQQIIWYGHVKNMSTEILPRKWLE